MDAGRLVGGVGEAALVVVLLAGHDGIDNFNDNIASKRSDIVEVVIEVSPDVSPARPSTNTRAR